MGIAVVLQLFDYAASVVMLSNTALLCEC